MSLRSTVYLTIYYLWRSASVYTNHTGPGSGEDGVGVTAGSRTEGSAGVEYSLRFLFEHADKRLSLVFSLIRPPPHPMAHL